MLVKEAESLETEEHVKAIRQEKEEVAKPVKKRPKSEGYELFEKEGYVIGLVSGSFGYKSGHCLKGCKQSGHKNLSFWPLLRDFVTRILLFSVKNVSKVVTIFCAENAPITPNYQVIIYT